MCNPAAIPMPSLSKYRAETARRIVRNPGRLALSGVSRFAASPSAIVPGLLLLVVFVACSSTTEQVERGGKTMREHERSFDASRYRDSTVTTAGASSSRGTARSRQHATEAPSTGGFERVMGFRVQLFSSADVEATRTRQEEMRSRLLELGLSQGRLDIIFDAPYHKLRFGDFATKKEADGVLRQLHQAGVKEAWIVRDNILLAR